MYPNTNVFGGVWYPVLCWGTGYLKSDKTIGYDDPYNGGGVILQSAKIKDAGEIIWKTNDVEYISGDIKVFPQGYRPGWILDWTAHTTRGDSWLEDVDCHLKLRQIINKWLQTACILTFYPQGNPDQGYHVYISDMGLDYLQSSLAGHATRLELIATELYDVNDVIVPDSHVNPSSYLKAGYWSEEDSGSLLNWGNTVWHRQICAKLDCHVWVRDDGSGQVEYYDIRGHYNPASAGSAYNTLTTGASGPWGGMGSVASEYYRSGTLANVMTMPDGVAFSGADADVTLMLRTRTSSDIVNNVQSFGCRSISGGNKGWCVDIRSSLVRVYMWRPGISYYNTAAVLSTTTWYDIIVRFNWTSGTLNVDIIDISGAAAILYPYSFSMGTSRPTYPDSPNRNFRFCCNAASPATLPRIQIVGLARRILSWTEIDEIRFDCWGCPDYS